MIRIITSSFFLWLFFVSLTMAQSNTKAELLTIAKELEEKNIHSKIVTQNIKAVRTPLIKKVRTKTKKSRTKTNKKSTVLIQKTTSQNIIETTRLTPTPNLTPVLLPIPKTPTPDVSAKKSRDPLISFGLGMNYLPLPGKRLNPANTISSWLSLSAKTKYINASIGFSEHSENNVKGAVFIMPINTKSRYITVNGNYNFADNQTVLIGYLYIPTKGHLEDATLSNAIIQGLYIGYSYNLSSQLNLSASWFPKLSNKYNLTFDPTYVSESEQPKSGFKQDITSGVFLFSLTYYFVSF